MDLPRGCRIVVTIPARNEEAFIVGCLESLFDQRSAEGEPLDPEAFAIVVVDSQCTDGTLRVVERAARARPEMRVTVVGAQGAGVAMARKAGMDLASRSLQSPRALLASIDADTVAHPHWLARTIALFDAQPGVAFAGGGFVYPDDFTARLARLRHYARTWRSISELLAPIRYVETVGSNFAIDARAYEAVGGIPLFTVGEDLGVAELAVARGLRGAWIPVANRTSERRALGDPADFLTGDYRFRAWGSHGAQAFQPCRATRGGASILADVDPELERELTLRCLRYFARQHVLKPLVLVPQFRRPGLRALGLDPAPFERSVEAAERAHPEGAPFHLEDRVLEVDAVHLGPVFGALVRALDAARDEDPASATHEIPFHVRSARASA